MSRRRWLPFALLPLLGAAACNDPEKPPRVSPPALDLSAMEPQVAARIEQARRAVERGPTARSWGRLGMVFHAHALYDQAVACYREAAARGPGDYRWPYLAALALVKSDPAAALDLFAAAARRSPPNAAFYVHFGDALLQAGEPQQAARRYRRALELQPEMSHALYGLARVAIDDGDAGKAVGLLERAARAAPNHGEVHALLAQLYGRLGEPEQAARHELLARAYPEATRPRDAVVEAMEAEAVSSRSYTQRGLRLIDEGRFAEAEETFRRVLEIRPGNARDHANLGGALARQGKLEEAIEHYRQALALDPDDPYAHNNLGMALAESGDLGAASRELETAIRIEATYAEAHHNLGLVRARAGDLEAAIAHYRDALRLAPSASVHTDLGTALASRGQLAAAIDHWRRALEIDPRELSACYNLSLALSQRGDHRGAIDNLRQGLAVAPNSSRLASLLAWELATAPEPELRDGAEALRLARRVYEAYGDRPSSFDLLAAALAESGDLAQAASTARRGLELARARGAQRLVAQLQARLAAYEQGRPFRQPSAAGGAAPARD
ncbi:MAG: tetratricopeptide repeat protein [Acidobacteria bacterium]|nr:MAG: tetratricopeptide repeat protein [Acidobacteriota bacterium]